VLFGRAATICYVPHRQDFPGEEKASFKRFFYEAITGAFDDTVLVLNSAGSADTSIGGGVKFSRLHNHYLAGLITDARIRDFDELARYSPVFYCSGEAVRAGSLALMPIAANVPVEIRGTTIVPGDYVYADGAGAVVVPAAAVDRVLELARETNERDKAYMEEIRGEDPAAISKQSRNSQ
jgi:regulator of RNase E activity RraA